MDPELKREVLDVRKAIERNTSKVSLRDLEKKGFRQVKVLRAGDINQLIFKAVQNVMAKAPQGGGAMSEQERQRIMAEAKAEVDRQLAETRALQQRAMQVEQAHKNLEQKLAEVNAQLAREKQVLIEEKAAFARDKQALMERSLEGQKVAAANYEGQIADLRDRLAKAEARAEAAAGGVSREEHDRLRQELARAEARLEAAEQKAAAAADGVSREEHERLRQELARAEQKAAAVADAVPRDEHEQLRKRFNVQVDDLTEDVERYRKKLRQVEEEGAEEQQALKRRAAELEESEARAQGRVKGLTEDVERLEQEVARLKQELEAGGGKGGGASDAELQRMRMEFEQRQARMQEMMAGIANTLMEARTNMAAAPAAAAESPDFTKQFASLQQNLSDVLRKAAGRGGSKDDLGFDLTAEQAAALFANMDESVKMESNIKDVKLKEQSAAGVKDKLAKLRNLRKK